mmetsp:Transcript_22044/g.32204  ORF Transcript_22044/g.32204 Transcript_22044/m.32204 type:complete len:203 (-) Transcript_22044:674-1282(-)
MASRLVVDSCSSMAAVTPRLTSSWWKWEEFISRMQRAASSSSRERRYSFNNWSITTLSSLTGLPSPGPHTFSSLTPQCSLDKRRTAPSITTPVRFERNAGGNTSSTTALARKAPTIPFASGASMDKSSSDSMRSSKPSAMFSSVNGSGCKTDSSLEISSFSREVLSRLMLTALFTTSGWYSAHFNSRMHRITSRSSPLSKYS